ncbi:MAG: glycosyltransferase involved in cell wall biosynthesis [Gammaproteobacteria bacterium]|jgi:glycosyltransferase involved in cell wall biosynthesis
MKFSLIIPCYNEAKNIPLLLERCASLALNEEAETEIILVDNGSTDETPQVLSLVLKDFPGCRSVRVETNKGYGFGILAGLNSAEGDILGWTHADMQTDPVDVLAGLEYFQEYGDNVFCKGERFGRPLLDTFFTVGMSLFESVLLQKPMWDINAQPTLFTREFFLTWDRPPHDFSLDLYAYFIAKKDGLSVHRFPVYFGFRAFGVSHWNVGWKAKLNFIKRTLSYSFTLKRNLNK